MKHRNITSAALAVALIATLLFGFGRGQGADVKKQVGKTAAQFDVPKGKDSKFYSELTDKLFHEFGEASRSIETQEEFKLLAKQLADALKTVYLYTKDGTDDQSKRTSSLAFSEACNFYAPFDYYDDLKELRNLAANDFYRGIADATIIPIDIRNAIAQDDKDALNALLEKFFEMAKSEKQGGGVGMKAAFIHEDLEKYDPEIAKAFSDRFVETFKDGAYESVANRLLGRERFKNLVGNDVKLEGLLSDGTEFDWDSYRGKVVLIDVWSPNTIQALSNHSQNRRLYEQYHDDGFEIVGYALHSDVDSLKRQEEEFNLPWKSISEKQSLQSQANGGKEYASLRKYYDLNEHGTTILVDRDGKAIETDVLTNGSLRSLKPYIEDALYGSVDESIFDVPDGKDLAFYTELSEKIDAAVARLFEKIDSQEDEDRVVSQWRGALTSLFKNAQDLPESEELCKNALASLSRIALVNRDVESVKKLLDVSNETYRERLESLAADVQARVEGRERFENLVGNEMKVEGLYLDGTEIDWSAYRGKVVLFDFWATWCGPCIAEIPNVQALYEKYHDAGFEVLGYSIDEKVDALKKFEEERKLPWKTASETLSVNAKENGGKKYVSLSDYYNITGVPTMILVGKDGKVLDTNARGAKLEKLLQEQFPDVK